MPSVREVPTCGEIGRPLSVAGRPRPPTQICPRREDQPEVQLTVLHKSHRDAPGGHPADGRPRPVDGSTTQRPRAPSSAPAPVSSPKNLSSGKALEQPLPEHQLDLEVRLGHDVLRPLALERRARASRPACIRGQRTGLSDRSLPATANRPRHAVSSPPQPRGAADAAESPCALRNDRGPEHGGERVTGEKWREVVVELGDVWTSPRP